MILERAVHPTWQSNTYLVASAPGADALFVDGGSGVEQLLARADELSLSVTHVLITHRHEDHVEEVQGIRARFPRARVLCHADEREHVPEATGNVRARAALSVGELTVEVVETPGHTRGSICVLVDGHLFTGDTLFRRSVGGVVSPGHTSLDDLKSSIMDLLWRTAPETVILPGHGEATTVGEEREETPFVRVWRGLDPQADEECLALGRPARLLLWAPDYDGGHKAWVRWPGGSEDILAGSKVDPPRG